MSSPLGEGVKTIDRAKTLLVLVVYKTGDVDLATDQDPAWVATALRDMASSIESALPENQT